MPLHELDPKRLHNDKVPPTPERNSPPPRPHRHKPELAGPDSEEAQSKGDPRLRDHVHFERGAHEAFSREFCVPGGGSGKGAGRKKVKRAKGEGDVLRADLHYLCDTLLTQQERRGYWEISALLWVLDPQGMPAAQEVVVFEYESLSFVVACEEKRLIRISERDIAAMLWPCLLDSDSDNPVVKKVGSTWVSHPGSEDKATFRWEIRGPQKSAEGSLAMRVLQQRARRTFFFTNRIIGPSKGGKGAQEAQEKERTGRRPGIDGSTRSVCL